MKKGIRFFSYVLAALIALVVTTLAISAMSGAAGKAESVASPNRSGLTLEEALEAARGK